MAEALETIRDDMRALVKRNRGIVVKEARKSQPTNFVNAMTVRVTQAG